MMDKTETAPDQKQQVENSHPRTQHRRKPGWFRISLIPGKHTESVIKLEYFIRAKYHDDDYMNERLIVAVQGYDDSEHVNSKQYDLFQRLLIIFSASTSFFIALEAIVVPGIILKAVPLLLSLIVGILGNYLTSFNMQAKREAYRNTKESLIAEFFKFHEGVTPYDTGTKRTIFVSNIEMIIKTANDNWVKLHQPGSGQENQTEQADKTDHTVGAKEQQL
jgi:Protein of unknown function (DUF4231)